MIINIYKNPMQTGYLFDTPVLYSPRPIPREDVPHGWYCCDLCGTVRAPDVPYKLVDRAEKNFAGSIFSFQPLKNGSAQSRLLKDAFWLSGEFATLDEFCIEENIPLPQTPIRHLMRPASPEEAGLFYALPQEKAEEQGAIGHVRIDFGTDGKEFWHTWWPRGPEELNTPEFRAELAEVVNDLRKGVLKDLPSMKRYCWGSDGAIEGGTCCQNYGFTLESERYIYRLRCNPIQGDYEAYLSCFDKQAQQIGLTEKGHQTLRNAANPTLAHSYDWYVIEHINTPERQATHQLPLEEAIQLYAGLDCEDKRLGVTKDDIAAVDLTIHWNGREWLSEDRLKLDSFKDDPVVADAAARLQQVLDESPAVGRITFASGERWNYTDPEKYLQAIREELPCQAAAGFRCETLTDDPAIRKAVDDMLFDLYGEENPHTLEDYGSTGMTSERYTKFGSTDSGHLSTDRLLGQEVLVFNSPVPEEAVPEGWHCYHLAGQDIAQVDQLLSEVPAEGYVGTVLSPRTLLADGEQSRGIDWSLSIYYGETPLEEYCERNHLPEPDISGIFPEQQAKTMEMGGMSCG